MRKFLFVTYSGLITDTAWRIKMEGNEVKFYIRDASEKEIGDGFVEKVDEWESHVDWADVIVFDDVLGMGTWAQELRQKGKAVIGGTPYTDLLEDDREFGQNELKKYGINIIPNQNFTSFQDAITYVKQNPGRYVIKPSGEAQNLKGLLFVGEEEDGKDVVQVLGEYNKALADVIPSFQLQKRVTGVEMAIGAYFNGNKFLEPVNVNFEHKKLFPGNLGPSTGEMGTAMFWTTSNRMFNKTLKKFEAKLREEQYVGYIDLNCIVNGNGIYPLEFTARFGYPTIFIQSEGIVMPMGEFFSRLANGEDFRIKTKTGFQMGVRVVVPPFPYSDPETFNVRSKDSVIYFKNKIKTGSELMRQFEGIHFEDVKQVNGEWLVTGKSGVVLTISGSGPTMKQTQQQTYSRVRSINIPHMYYRTDIGNRWFEDSDKLHNWGYLREA